MEADPEARVGCAELSFCEAAPARPPVLDGFALDSDGPDVDLGRVLGGEELDRAVDLKVYTVGEAVVLEDAPDLESLRPELAGYRSLKPDTLVA